MTMYEFGETIGGLERCYYFGHGKDLYHFDHFMGETWLRHAPHDYTDAYSIYSGHSDFASLYNPCEMHQCCTL